jgi:RNA polymerase sigma factor (sigma-70 family)
VAPTDSSVLVFGETGTGKELIARAIHNISSRCVRPFVKLNCAAIPFDLLESELFGHEKGAFTGAVAQKVGRFEMADTGTLFLDEIGDLPLALQPKLLHVLQEQEFERLGSVRTHRINVRLVAATHRDLAHMVARNEFRCDLYYRLNVFPVLVPPLRERRDDIPQMVLHFVEVFSRRMGKRIENIPQTTMDVFSAYHWPGNVRELQNLVERAVIRSDNGTLPNPFSKSEANCLDVVSGNPHGTASSTYDLRELERANLLSSNCHASGGLTSAETARHLGLTVSAVKARTFHARRYLRKYIERRYKPSSRAIQRSEHGTSLSQPLCLPDLRKSTRHIIVSTKTCADNDGLSTFLSTRARLFGIAHRILRNAPEAEDILQDVWIRWQMVDRSAVRDATAFLTTMTTRLAINVIQSARLSRARSLESLREAADKSPDPELESERSEALWRAVLVILERLSPAERAAYVLREAFDYSYREIANLLRLREGNARQLVTRARQHAAHGQHSSVNLEEQRRFFAAFVAAAENGALKNLEFFLVCGVDGTVGERTGSTPVEAIAMPRHYRWRLLPQLDARVA